MKLISLTLLLAIICCLSLGCVESSLRFAPKEPQKESADAAYRLSMLLAASGSAPGDPGPIALANLSQPGANYMGAPSKPMNIDPLAKASLGKWDSLKLRNTMNELRERCSRKVAEMVSKGVTEVASRIASVEDGKSIDRAEVVAALASIQQLSAMGTEFTESIQVPEEKKTSQATLDQLAAMQADTLDMLLAANKAAALKPTGKDVADDVVNQANGVLDYAGELIEANPGLSSLLGLVGLGVPGVYLKKRATGRRMAKEEKDKADERKDRDSAAANVMLAQLLADKPVK